jgi:hypothetical protein
MDGVPAVVCSVLFLSLQAVSKGEQNADFFENHVRPVLSNNCYSCHTETRSGGLRLDSRQDLLKGGKSGPAIEPGNPDQSLLFEVVSHIHDQIKMPPGGKLKDNEIADIRTWIANGADWPESKGAISSKIPDRVITPEERNFWSFQALHRPATPQVKDLSWPKTTIDRFILAKLEERGLKPVRAADRYALIRRATFDLIGLPPTFDEVQAFVKDTSSAAFEKVVDRLLASPHFGERWARYWLDIARFGEQDVHGLGVENYPNAWRYRDWVIDAFHRDLPYSAFIKAQIAGDLMEPVKGMSMVAATGFLGLGPWYYDMAEPPQARADERHDRIDATTRGFLSLTVACSRCHNHKFDPVSMKDYYALGGVFAGTEYREYPLAPAAEVERYETHQKKIKNQEEAIKKYIAAMNDQLAQILATKTSRYVVASYKVLGPQKPDRAAVATADKLDREVLDRWVQYLKPTKREHPYLKDWDDMIARGRSEDEARQIGAALQDLALSVYAEKKADDEENKAALEASNAKKPGVSTKLPNGYASFDMFCDGCYFSTKVLARDRFIFWSDLFGTYANEAKKKDTAIYLFEGKQIDRWISGEFKDHLDTLRTDLAELKRTLPKPYPYLHGVGDTQETGNIRLNLRGSPYNLGEEVARHFPAILCNGEPQPFRNGSGRLELAEAIVNHPLSARVAANRVWMNLFGQGIVRTPSNFGKMGQRPSHPELLEYLAGRLIDSEWSTKKLIREVMLSSAYQLSSDSEEKNASADPENILVWRMNRRRLDAESIRDAILFASGDLDLKVGGDSADLTSDFKRRTVYATVSRFKVNETLALFDFPPPSISSEKRNVTHVPLQRLFFLNSDLVMNESKRLSGALCNAAGTDEARVAEAYRRIFGRAPEEAETALALQFVRQSDPSSSKSNETAWPQLVQVLFSSNEFSFID